MKTLESLGLRARPALLALAVAGLAAVTLPASAQTQPASGQSGQQQWVNSMKQVYRTSASNAPAQAAQQMNSAAMTDPVCDGITRSKQAAAQQYVRNRLPPDPTTVIQGSTCFLDVMDIAIPTTGYGFLDAIMRQLTPYLQTTACQSSMSWWNGMKNNMLSGNLSGLNNQVFSAVASAAGNSGLSYSGLLSGSQQRATSLPVVPYVPSGSTGTGTGTGSVASSGLPQNVQLQLDLINSNAHFNNQLVSSVNNLSTVAQQSQANQGWWSGSSNEVLQQISNLRSLLGLP